MAFDDRLQFLLLGMAIGFVLGYLVRLVREIKEELDEVKGEIEEDLALRTKDDAGFMRVPIVQDIAVLLAVGLTFWASIVSQKASNGVTDNQDRIDTAITCMFESQGAALTALNERATYTVATANANIDLQQSQSRFFDVLLHQPPFSETRQTEAVQQYYSDLQEFLVVAKKGATTVANNPFPTAEDLQNCLDDQE